MRAVVYIPLLYQRNTKAFLLLLLLGLVVWLFVFDPQHVASTPPCLFKLFTSLDCPGCGTARACHQLLHGNLMAAMDYNILFVSMLPLMMGKLYGYLFNRKLSWPDAIYKPGWILYGVLVFWVVRNLPFSFFSVLRS